MKIIAAIVPSILSVVLQLNTNGYLNGITPEKLSSNWGLVVALFIIGSLLLVAVFARSKGDKDSSAFIMLPFISVPNRNRRISQLIRRHDQAFSSKDFVDWSGQIFKEIQDAWTARKLESVRHLLYKDLYIDLDKQIKSQYTDKNLKNIISKISIKSAYLTSYMKFGCFEYVSVYLSAKMSDMVIDENSKNIVSGDIYALTKRKYKMRFMRRLDLDLAPAWELQKLEVLDNGNTDEGISVL